MHVCIAGDSFDWVKECRTLEEEEGGEDRGGRMWEERSRAEQSRAEQSRADQNEARQKLEGSKRNEQKAKVGLLLLPDPPLKAIR